MKTNIKTNMGRWNEVDDNLLARIVVEGVRAGSTQQQAFERAGFALNRTTKACGYRWNNTLRPIHADALKQAVKEHRFSSGKIRSMRVPNYDEREYGVPVKEVMHPDDAKLIAENSAKPEIPIPNVKATILPSEPATVEFIGSPIKPAHYHKGGIDVIGFLGSHFGGDEGYTVLEAFCIGNIVKYVTRYKQKNGIEDLEKAEYYLNKLKQQGE